MLHTQHYIHRTQFYSSTVQCLRASRGQFTLGMVTLGLHTASSEHRILLETLFSKYYNYFLRVKHYRFPI